MRVCRCSTSVVGRGRTDASINIWDAYKCIDPGAVAAAAAGGAATAKEAATAATCMLRAAERAKETSSTSVRSRKQMA